jgi:hypothetical protein
VGAALAGCLAVLSAINQGEGNAQEPHLRASEILLAQVSAADDRAALGRLYDAGLRHLRAGREAEAQRSFDALIDRLLSTFGDDERTGGTIFGIAEAFARLGRPSTAEVYFGRALSWLDAAPTRGWHVASMRDDWARIFP